MPLRKSDFEVFGKVQGVFFRKFTQNKANELKVRGFIQNSPNGTVVGAMEGEEESYSQMRDWLQNTGSPMSRIDKAVFTDERPIDKYSYKDFSIKR